MLTDLGREQIQADYQAQLAAEQADLDDEEFQELYWTEHIARLEEQEAEDMYAHDLEVEREHLGSGIGGQHAAGQSRSTADAYMSDTDDLPNFSLGIL